MRAPELALVSREQAGSDRSAIAYQGPHHSLTRSTSRLAGRVASIVSPLGTLLAERERDMTPESAANDRNRFGLQVWQRAGHIGKRPNLETFNTGESGLPLFDVQKSSAGLSLALAALHRFIRSKTVSLAVGPHPSPANGNTSIQGHFATERSTS